MIASWQEICNKPRQCVKKQRHHFANKIHLLKAVVFPVATYSCENWTIKKVEHQRIELLNCVDGEDSWKSLGQQGDQSFNPKRNQPWIFIGKTGAEAEAQILWPLDAKSWLIGKDPVAKKDLSWKEKGVMEDKILRWHHWLSGKEFEQTPGDSEGQGSLARCSPWGRKESDMI